MDEDGETNRPDHNEPSTPDGPAMPRGLVIIGLALFSWLVVGILLAAIFMILN